MHHSGEQSSRVVPGGMVYTSRDDCRLCKSRNLEGVWSFGPTPLANSYLRPNQLGQPEPIVPLDVYYCHDCSLVQLKDIVSPEVMFSHYLYVSSTSPKFVQHFEDYAEAIINQFNLDNSDFVVDIGSNDGILLKPLKEKGIQILGVDPAQNIAQQATAEGIETIAAFFTPDIARAIKVLKGPASVITANNVFAHTDNIDGTVDAIKELLTEDGVFIFEVQYLKDLVEKNLFDIVYHEHVNYYHLHPLVTYFKNKGLEVFDVNHVPVHGGSIRVMVQRASGPHEQSQTLRNMLAAEEKASLNSINTHMQFAKRININKHKLRDMIKDIKKQGKTIVGYGAPAKATTLLYAFGLGASDIDYIVDDDSRYKQGLHMPGNHIPIKSPEELYTSKPDYCLILAWNFAEPIMQNHKKYQEQGGKFINPIPEPKLYA